VNFDVLIVFSIWILTVVISGICIGKLLWRDSLPTEVPLGVRFAFSAASFLPSFASLIDALLTFNSPGNGGEGANNGIFVVLFLLDLLALPVAICAAIFPPYSKLKLLQHTMSGSVALSALVGVGAMSLFAVSI
jgi:hypothetical protein